MSSNITLSFPYPYIGQPDHTRAVKKPVKSGRNGMQNALRIALYSHDTMGLGHFRRNMRIAKALRQAYPSASVLLITGTRISQEFEPTPGIDILSLPAFYKNADGSYQARYLDTSVEALTALRTQTIRGALMEFRPDVFIVDNVPRGAQNELDDVLPELRRKLGTRCVLGLRDIIDDPAAARREWLKKRCEFTIQQNYHVVWVYGDPEVYDLAQEYRLTPATRAMMRFTGYLDASTQDCETRLNVADIHSMTPNRHLALCMLGGGQDGAQLADAFAHCTLPEDTNALLLTGPDFPPAHGLELKRLTALNPRLEIVDFISTPLALLEHADKIIAMGGYNTVYELLSCGKHPLIVPRVKPRQEQLVRAERLQALGMVDMLHPDQLNSQNLGAWLAQPPGKTPTAKHCIDFSGLDRLPQLLAELINTSSDRVAPLQVVPLQIAPLQMDLTS